MKNEAGLPASPLIGRKVCQNDWQGRAHSIFSRAVNLAVGDTLFTLITEPRWISESSALVRPAALAGAGRGAAFSFQEGRLFLDGRPLEDYRQAEVWRMPELPAGGPEAAGTARLALELERRPAPPLIALVESKFAEQAAAFVAGKAADFSGIIGAGPGLTPAGDDMLCGFALALAARAPGRLPELEAACRPGLGNTTDVSRHLLREALRGSFGFPLLNLLFALQGRADFAAALELALSIGASSGRDGALGLCHGLRLL